MLETIMNYNAGLLMKPRRSLIMLLNYEHSWPNQSQIKLLGTEE